MFDVPALHVALCKPFGPFSVWSQGADVRIHLWSRYASCECLTLVWPLWCSYALHRNHCRRTALSARYGRSIEVLFDTPDKVFVDHCKYSVSVQVNLSRSDKSRPRHGRKDKIALTSVLGSVGLMPVLREQHEPCTT